jgi:hypothetical protein
LSKSEVARLRQRIEEEITSMHLLMNGPAVVGRHELITHKYRNLGAYHQELTQLVGEQPAAMIVNETYYRIIEGDEPCNNHA